MLRDIAPMLGLIAIAVGYAVISSLVNYVWPGRGYSFSLWLMMLLLFGGLVLSFWWDRHRPARHDDNDRWF